MTEHRHEQEGLEARARRLFDESVEAVDGPTRARLHAARREAVAEVERRTRRRAWNSWVPAAAAAGIAALALVLWRTPVAPPQEVANGASAVEVIELVAAGEDFDLVTGELEFYESLDQLEFELNTHDIS